MGGGLIHTSRAVLPSPCAWTRARALPGLVSRCSTRLAWAYSTASDLTCSKLGRRITVRSRGGRLALAARAGLGTKVSANSAAGPPLAADPSAAADEAAPSSFEHDWPWAAACSAVVWEGVM